MTNQDNQAKLIHGPWDSLPTQDQELFAPEGRKEYAGKWRLVVGAGALGVAAVTGFAFAQHDKTSIDSNDESHLMQQVHENPADFTLVNESGGVGVQGAAAELTTPGTPENKTLTQEFVAQANSQGGLDAGQYAVEKSAITIPQPSAAEMPVVQGFTPVNQQ